MALQVNTNQPCPQWDTKPQPQHMPWPGITADSITRTSNVIACIQLGYAESTELLHTMVEAWEEVMRFG